MRALAAATAALMPLAAGVADADDAVRQAGTSSQGGRVALVSRADMISRFTIVWRARCPGTSYTGSSDVRRIPLRADGSFRAALKYTHRLDGGRRAKVAVTITGSVSGDRARAAGTFLGAAKVDRLGTCRSGRVTWKTRVGAA